MKERTDGGRVGGRKQRSKDKGREEEGYWRMELVFLVIVGP